MRFCFALLVPLGILFSCKKDKGAIDYGYPREIAEIIVNRCATSGCHNTTSSDACGGLDLSTWEALFKGSRANSSIIPYRPDHSFLFFSINTFNELGPRMEPVMPLNKQALGKDELITIRNWISNGAPDNKGFVKFSDISNRRKIYVANQACDIVTVFDAKSKLIMRAFDVGNLSQTEAPHDMIVSPDGEHLYLSFFAGNLFQKYRTSDNSKVGEIVMPDYSWHSLEISGDSKIGITTHLNSNGKIAVIDLAEMKTLVSFAGSVYPHGCILNHNGSIAYVTSQQGNFLYKIDLSDKQNISVAEIPLQTGQIPNPAGIYKPYAIEYFPDNSMYAVTCQGTNELRVFDAAKDSLLAVIKTTGVPQLMSFSSKLPYLFVSCMEDSANIQTMSRVDVINYKTLNPVTSVFTGYQPRGIAVDDDNNCVWVANRNISAVGWAPHHTTACNGKNGYITLIDMNTLNLVPKWKAEVSVDPYCITIRK